MKRNTTYRTADSAVSSVDASKRTVTFVLSDSSVARDGHTLATKGWKLENYKQNPVVLFAHIDNQVENVIGRMASIWTQGDRLLGKIEFMSGSINPVAEMVFQMVKEGYLNAVSVGFIPTKGKPAVGRGSGAYDYSEQELLEVSVVPTPALATALAEGRKTGIGKTLRAFRAGPITDAERRAEPLWKQMLRAQCEVYVMQNTFV